MMKQGRRRMLFQSIAYTILLIYICLSLFPIGWGFVTSVKSSKEVYRLPPVWVPQVPQWGNYVKVFMNRPFFHYMKNSLIIAIFVTFLCLTFGVMGGYGFSRSRRRIGKYAFSGVITSRIIPPISLIIPFIIIYNAVGLRDTRTGMILAGLFLWLPFTTWIMKNYFDSLPEELLDSARIDGCNEFTAFYKVMLPLTKPGLIASAILSFTYTWNEYTYALALTRVEARTIPVGLTDFFLDDTILWNQLCAASMIAIIPPIIFVVFAQRFIVKGLLGGALKG